MIPGGLTGFSGQSGVGKSTLLHSIQPGLNLRFREVSDWTSKGKHTTTHAELIRLEEGGGGRYRIMINAATPEPEGEASSTQQSDEEGCPFAEGEAPADASSEGGSNNGGRARRPARRGAGRFAE